MTYPLPGSAVNWLAIWLVAAALGSDWKVASSPASKPGPAPIIRGIEVEGNEFTRDLIILREITHQTGVPFDSSIAAADRNRLYNLGIFDGVELSLRLTPPDSALLVATVDESIRFIPYPTMYYLNELGWSFGGGVIHTNFKGLNQSINIGGMAGAEDSYYLTFSDPWLFGERISLDWWITQTHRGSPVYAYRYGERDIEFGIGKYYLDKTVHIRAALSLEDRWLHWQDMEQSEAYGGELRHRVFQMKYEWWWRTTDIWRDPTEGSQIELKVQPVIGLDGKSPEYSWFFGSAGTFHTLKSGYRPLVGGAGAAVSYYTKAVPLYAREFIGGEWIRGYFTDPEKNPQKVRNRLESTGVLVLRLELRQTILPRRIISSTELGVGSVLFLESGWGIDRTVALARSMPVVGYGLGLRLFFTSFPAFGIDLGFNPYEKKVRKHLTLGHRF